MDILFCTSISPNSVFFSMENINSSSVHMKMAAEIGPTKGRKELKQSVVAQCKENVYSNGESDFSEKESYVDSEDSGLFKANYVFKLNKLKAKKIATEGVKRPAEAKRKAFEHYKVYNEKSSDGKLYTIPLGQEMNWQFDDDLSTVSTLSTSSISGRRTTNAKEENDDLEMEMKKDFTRELERVLKTKQDVRAFKNQTLKDEYRRLISEKMKAVSKSTLKDLAREPTDYLSDEDCGRTEANPSGAVAAIEPAGGGGDISNEKTEIIVSHLSKCILKNQFSSPKLPNSIEQYSHREAKESSSVNFKSDFSGYRRAERIFKVEKYLDDGMTHRGNYSSNDSSPDIDDGEEFDRLIALFLRNDQTNLTPGEMSKIDRRLLEFLTTEFVKNRKIRLIEKMLSVNLEEDEQTVSPVNKTEDQKEYFMKRLIVKYLKRGMRATLEDQIAQIYYKIEATKMSSPSQPNKSVKNDDSVTAMVEAFNTRGNNKYLNRIVTELTRDLMSKNAELVDQTMSTVRQKVRNSVVARFAKLFLETSNPAGKNEEDGSNIVMNRTGTEHFCASGQHFEIRWKQNEDQLDRPVELGILALKGSEEKSPNEASSENDLMKPLPTSRKAIVTQNEGSSILKDPLSFRVASKYRTSNKHLNEKGRRSNKKHKVEYLLERKKTVWEKRGKEALRLERFSESLPKRLEHFIEIRRKIQEQYKTANRK